MGREPAESRAFRACRVDQRGLVVAAASSIAKSCGICLVHDIEGQDARLEGVPARELDRVLVLGDLDARPATSWGFARGALPAARSSAAFSFASSLGCSFSVVDTTAMKATTDRPAETAISTRPRSCRGSPGRAPSHRTTAPAPIRPAPRRSRSRRSSGASLSRRRLESGDSRAQSSCGRTSAATHSSASGT